MSKLELRCDICGTLFLREKKEVTRSKKLGRKNFCSLSCYGKSDRNVAQRGWDEETVRKNRANIKKYCGSWRDEFTPFRFFMKVIRGRRKKIDVDLKYLKEVWENQHGICPLTGWKMTLPHSTIGWKNDGDKRSPSRASLDRIDGKLGYVRGNVRFVCFMANLARNNMGDAALIRFCKAVTKNTNVKKSSFQV